MAIWVKEGHFPQPGQAYSPHVSEVQLQALKG